MSKLIVAFVVALFCSGSAAAEGTCTSCTIKSIGVGPHYDALCLGGSCVVIMMDSTPGGRPSCSVSSWHFVPDTSTEAGRKTLAVLMMAYAQDKALNVAGSGGCTMFGDAENLLYGYIAD